MKNCKVCRDHGKLNHNKLNHREQLLPVHVDRRGQLGAGAEADEGGIVALHVVPHHRGRRLHVGVDLPEDNLHELVVGQREANATELILSGGVEDLIVSSLLLNLPDSTGGMSN